MKSIAILGIPIATVMYASFAQAQTVVTQPAPQQPQTTVVTQPTPAPAVVAQPAPPAQQQTIVAVPAGRETAATGGPNSTLFMNGLFTLGIPYGISVVVAAESDRDGDKNLFIPVVGPWMAFANEGTCSANNISCGRTTGNKVLLATDGIFQALGAIELVAAFAFPERVVATASGERRVLVAPSRLGTDGYGVAAVGAF